MGSADEFRGATEFCARSGRGDLRERLASTHERSGEGSDAGGCFYGNRFAGKHRLIKQDFSPSDVHIRGDHAAARELHNVARNQFGRGRGFPHAVASNGGVQREPRLQRGEGRLSAVS